MHEKTIADISQMITELEAQPAHGPWVDVAVGGLRTAREQLRMDQERLDNLAKIKANESLAKK